MAKEEQETIICVNDADLDEGFISISTSKPDVALRLKRRLGSKNIIDEKQSISSQTGKIVYWQFKVRKECWSNRAFCLRKPSSAERSEKAIAATHRMRQALAEKKANEAKERGL